MDDLISREEAIEEMAELQGRASSKAELTGISKAWKRIKALPSARKKGEWILKDRDGSWAYWTCSECGRFVLLNDYKENVQEEYPFCHCGAYMGER